MSENYNFEEAMKKQEENTGKLQNSAIDQAKKEIAEEKLASETREVKHRLKTATQVVENAERNGRFASKHKNIMKNFSEKIVAAKKKFEETANYKEWDETYEKLVNEKDEAIEKAKEEIFGSRWQRICL